MVELQAIHRQLAESGISLFAISYDSVATLRDFAVQHGIDYPLLSDRGSAAIRRLGLLDVDLAQHHAEFGRPVRDEQWGVAYPAVFVLSEDGIVEQRRLQPNYRLRENGRTLLERALGMPAEPAGDVQAVEAPAVVVRVRADASAYLRYQIMAITVDVDVSPGYHVYGAPAPAEFQALSIRVGPLPGLELYDLDLPEPPYQLRMDGLPDRFWVYEGRVRAVQRLALALPQGHGGVGIPVEVDLQACSDSACLMPQTHRFRVDLEEGAIR